MAIGLEVTPNKDFDACHNAICYSSDKQSIEGQKQGQPEETKGSRYSIHGIYLYMTPAIDCIF